MPRAAAIAAQPATRTSRSIPCQGRCPRRETPTWQARRSFWRLGGAAQPRARRPLGLGHVGRAALEAAVSLLEVVDVLIAAHVAQHVKCDLMAETVGPSQQPSDPGV